eukprot:11061442-Karenia_brevis.AAC.1
MSELEAVSIDEVTNELSKMAKRKTGDRAGIVVEMLQQGTLLLREIIAEMLTKVLQFEWPPPDSWRRSFVTVLYKKGD